MTPETTTERKSMNVFNILLAVLGAAPQFMQLLAAIIGEVHTIQAALPGAPGADKSAAVIAKVTPIAEVVGAELPHVQSLINQVVDVSKAAGIGAWGTADQANTAGA
jgi:shikimate kinase